MGSHAPSTPRGVTRKLEGMQEANSLQEPGCKVLCSRWVLYQSGRVFLFRFAGNAECLVATGKRVVTSNLQLQLERSNVHKHNRQVCPTKYFCLAVALPTVPHYFNL